MSRVGKALANHLTPDDPPPSRRFTITIQGEAYERVQEVAKRLHMSWAATANLLLLPAAEDALEWIEKTGLVVTSSGLSPELLQALQDGPESSMYQEARERSGMARMEELGMLPTAVLQQVEVTVPDDDERTVE